MTNRNQDLCGEHTAQLVLESLSWCGGEGGAKAWGELQAGFHRCRKELLLPGRGSEVRCTHRGSKQMGSHTQQTGTMQEADGKSHIADRNHAGSRWEVTHSRQEPCRKQMGSHIQQTGTMQEADGKLHTEDRSHTGSRQEVTQKQAGSHTQETGSHIGSTRK